ncbi:MAG: flagellar basal body P-ring protein FlgI [Candidatus Hydrogenedentota bacterium]|nr:MAG: flagellar basal body P-ring protein FlgI [Candidatus Hydrogenedentota bacterium]
MKRRRPAIRGKTTASGRFLRLFGIGTLALFLSVMAADAAPSVRIKDIARLEGVRDNQLVGYGLVIGLAGTGDSRKSQFTILTVVSMLEKLGVEVARLKTLAQFGNQGGQGLVDPKNMAAVIVTATLPPFATEGSRLDVTVSSIGDAESLQGGILLQAPLLGADGRVYAVAQGPISLGGLGQGLGGAAAQQAGGASFHKTTGRIPSGATIEKTLRSDFVASDGTLTWVLRRPDFATASHLADAINAAFSPPIAHAVDAERVRVTLPRNYASDPVKFVATIEDILLKPDAPAKVIVNERTGTIVFGENARISFVAVSHGNLSVTIKGEEAPNAPAGGGLAAATVQLEEGKESTLYLPETGTVKDLVRALNSIGATPRDIIAVLQAVAEAGALHAELEFI